MVSDAREEMIKKSKEQKLRFVMFVYSGIITEHAFNTDKMSPKKYVDYLKTVSAEIIKSLSMTAGAHALEYVNNLAKAITYRVINQQSTPKSSTIHNSKLSFAEIREVLMQLRVDCSRQSLSWLVQFIDIGGLSALFSLLDAIHKKTDKFAPIILIIRKPKHHEVEAEVLKVMKIVANHEVFFILYLAWN